MARHPPSYVMPPGGNWSGVSCMNHLLDNARTPNPSSLKIGPVTISIGFDYNGTIETLKRFRCETEDLLEFAVANGHDRLAKSVRETIVAHDKGIVDIAAIRDAQS